ncbi:MAG: caspase family protein [Crocinitomicaceae bacterium]
MRACFVVVLALIVSALFAQGNNDHYLTIHPNGHKGLIHDMGIDHEGNIVTGSFDKNTFVWSPQTGRIIKEFRGKIGPGSEGMVYAVDVAPNGQYIAVAGWMGKNDETEALGDIRIYNYSTGKMKACLHYHQDAVYDLKFAPDSRHLISGDASGYLCRWDTYTMTPVTLYQRENKGFHNLVVAADFFITSHDDGMVYKWKYEKEKADKKFKFFNKINALNIKSEVAISADGTSIAVAGKEIGMVLLLNQKFSLQQHFFTPENTTITGLALAPSSERLAVSIEDNGHHSVNIYELKKGKWEGRPGFKSDDLITGLEFLDENTLVSTGGRANEINIWQVGEDQVKNKKRMKGVGANYYSAGLNGNEVAFSNQPTKAYGNADYEKIFNLFDRKISEKRKDVTFNYPQRNKDGWRLYEYNFLRKDSYDPSQILLIENSNGVIKDSIVFHPWDGNQFYSYTFVLDDYIVVGGAYGILQAYNRSGRHIGNFVGHEGGIRSVSTSENGKFIVSSGVDMTIRFWPVDQIPSPDTQTPTNIAPTASLFIADNKEWVLWNKEGYFTSSKKGARYVGYHVNQGKEKESKFYPFDQFDIKYNRPDILLKDLDLADPGIIELYEKAYQRRLKRMGLKEEDLSSEIHTPEITAVNYSKNTDRLRLKIQAKDEKYHLSRLNIFLNDVPVFGRQGRAVESGKTLNTEEEIQLIPGKNKVEVSVLNSKGAESLRETKFIDYTSTEKSNLYVVGIGVSDYQDANYNLNYAAKDAVDVVQLFTGKDVFGKVHSKQMLNEEVNRKGIQELKKFFELAGANDVVLLFIAGHGVLDADYNYFFGTHDMDFSQPEKRGMSYGELEVLFDGIPAIRKLLIMDTCHSGELYEDEVEEIVAGEDSGGQDIVFRTSKTTTTISEKKGLKKTNEAVKEMFNDLNRGTGTTVISSAGGVEYAMESDKWKNGLFTYCLIRGLKELKADENQDGKVYLSELQAYIHKEVYLLSQGKQAPTSRFENLSLDYQVW